MKIKNNIIKDKNIYFSATDEFLIFPDKECKRKHNEALSDYIDKWIKSINQNKVEVKNFVFLSTFLSRPFNISKADFENLLLYNLNRKTNIDKLIKDASRIIFQGFDCIDELNLWPSELYDYYFCYFYGIFCAEEYKNYLLYKFNQLNEEKYLKIKISQERDNISVKDKFDKLKKMVKSIRNSNINMSRLVPKYTKYILKIIVESSLADSVENIKKLVDCIVTYCNLVGIIETPDNWKVFIDDNKLNPTDELLYYCEILKKDDIEDISFCVSSIKPSEAELRNNLNNYWRLLTDIIK